MTMAVLFTIRATINPSKFISGQENVQSVNHGTGEGGGVRQALNDKFSTPAKPLKHDAFIMVCLIVS